MGQVDKNSSVATTKGRKTYFYKGFDDQLTKLKFESLADKVDSDSSSETYKSYGMMPVMQEMKGEIQPKGLFEHSFTIANKEWEASLRVHKRAWKREIKTGMLKKNVMGMGKRCANHRLKRLTQILELGESELCLTGQYFFDTDHSWGISGAWSNDLTYDAASTTTLTSIEAMLILDAADIKHRSAKDDQGEPMGGKLTDVMPPVEYLPAFRKLQTSGQISDGTTEISNPWKDNFNIITNQYIASASTRPRVYTLDLSDELKPFIFQLEEDVILEELLEGSDEYVKTGFMVFKGGASYELGYGLPFLATITTVS